MTSLLARLIGKVPVGPLSRVQKFQADPVAAQERVLTELLTKACDTEWGRRYDFRGILASDDVAHAYRQAVPIHHYRDMQSAVARMRRGERDILWPGRIKYFAASSGTTATGRIIPVTADMIAANRRFSLAVVLNYLAATGKTRLLGGKILALPGWMEDDDVALGTRIGQISAVLAEAQSGLLRPWSMFGRDVAFIENWEEKMVAVADRSIEHDVRMIAIAPSWCQVLFRLVRQRNLERTGRRQTIGEIWPNLGLVVTGGVALSGYREMLSEHIGRPDVDFVETYGASEGFISFQDDLADPSMLVHLDNGVFMEFVPFEDDVMNTSPRLTIGEVEVGPRYAIHLTSNSGFWSYALGDVVRFTSLSPHRMVVTGRTVDMLDKYGEAVFGEEARQAFLEACRSRGVVPGAYHVTHTVHTGDGTPAHEWLVEFETVPSDMAAFANLLDRLLADAGHHYQDRREGGAFGFPVITPLPIGTFYGAMEAQGMRLSVQSKVPAMREDRSFADAVLDYAGKRV